MKETEQGARVKACGNDEKPETAWKKVEKRDIYDRWNLESTIQKK